MACKYRLKNQNIVSLASVREVDVGISQSTFSKLNINKVNAQAFRNQYTVRKVILKINKIV